MKLLTGAILLVGAEQAFAHSLACQSGDVDDGGFAYALGASCPKFELNAAAGKHHRQDLEL